jgi:hypothetical protein
MNVEDVKRLLGRTWATGFHYRWYMTRPGYYTPAAGEPGATMQAVQAAAK